MVAWYVLWLFAVSLLASCHCRGLNTSRKGSRRRRLVRERSLLISYLTNSCTLSLERYASLVLAVRFLWHMNLVRVIFIHLIIGDFRNPEGELVGKKSSSYVLPLTSICGLSLSTTHWVRQVTLSSLVGWSLSALSQVRTRNGYHSTRLIKLNLSPNNRCKNRLWSLLQSKKLYLLFLSTLLIWVL